MIAKFMNAWMGKVCNIISIVNMLNNMLIIKTYIVSKIQNTSMTFLFNY